jgi:hypothetical protein
MASNSRTVELRKSHNIDYEKIGFPLLFARPQFGYSINSILEHIHTNNDIYLGPDTFTFPDTIQEFYWISEGEPGQKPWVALGRVQIHVYFLYKAHMIMPSSTFVNNGQMSLWVSTRYSDIIHFAMDSSIYKLYKEETNLALN